MSSVSRAMRARFSVEVTPGEDASGWSAAGWDTIQYRIATNPGEPLKPLTEIASGGEMSRVMLALKVAVEEQAAKLARKKGAALPRTLPTPPAGFDPRLYLVSQPDVSGANDTIRLSMLALGLTPRAIEHRGVYVATLAEDVHLVSQTVAPATYTFHRAAGACNFSPSNVREGDSVRLQLGPGAGACPGFLHGLVTSVSGTALSIAPEPSAAAVQAARLLAAGGNSNYELLGIRVYDAERQAMSALARMGPGTGDDAVPRPGFSLGTYLSVTPGARSLTAPDAYLDFRERWRRTTGGGAYRVAGVDDVVNASAPFSALTGALQVGGRVGIGMKCLSDTGVPADATVKGAASESGGTRLAVDGDIFATGTLLTLSDARAKSNIEPISDALGRIAKLSGCTYAMADGRDQGDGRETHNIRRHTGLLAQDVAIAMPEAVYKAPDAALPGMQGPGSIAYGNLAGLFVEAIKELTARVSALEAASS